MVWVWDGSVIGIDIRVVRVRFSVDPYPQPKAFMKKEPRHPPPLGSGAGFFSGWFSASVDVVIVTLLYSFHQIF